MPPVYNATTFTTGSLTVKSSSRPSPFYQWRTLRNYLFHYSYFYLFLGQLFKTPCDHKIKLFGRIHLQSSIENLQCRLCRQKCTIFVSSKAFMHSGILKFRNSGILERIFVEMFYSISHYNWISELKGLYRYSNTKHFIVKFCFILYFLTHT